MPQGQYPTVYAGANGVASLLQALAPLNAYKSGDTSRASTTALTADPDLTIHLSANATYFFVMVLDYEGGTQGSSDLAFDLTGPSGATARFWMGNMSTAGVSTAAFMGQQGVTYSAGSNGAGNLQGVLAAGTIFTSGSSGFFTLNWAQKTSSATATIVHAQSALMAWRLA